MASEGIEMANLPKSSPAVNTGSPGRRLPKWFLDQTNTNEQQAAYLAKIYRMKDELIKEERTNMKTAVERVSHRGTVKNKTKAPPTSLKWKPGTGPGTGPSIAMTARERQLEKIRCMRQRPQQPVLHPIQGQTLVDSPRRGSSDSKMRSDIEPTGLSFSRKNSFLDAFLNNSMDSSNSGFTQLRSSDGNHPGVTSLMQNIIPTASIPNIGRRAVNATDKIAGFTVKKAENPHDKERDVKPKGKLYKVTERQRRLLKADSDELDLSPETYRFDLPYEDNMSRLYRKGERTLAVPNTTPVSFAELRGRELDDAIIKQVRWSNDLVVLRKPRQTSMEAFLAQHSPSNEAFLAQHSLSNQGSPDTKSREELKLPQINSNNNNNVLQTDTTDDQCPVCVVERMSNSDSPNNRKHIHIDMPSLGANSPQPNKHQSRDQQSRTKTRPKTE